MQWYAAFGSLVGLFNPALLLFLQPGWFDLYTGLVFAAAGAGAGLIYFFVEQLENAPGR